MSVPYFSAAWDAVGNPTSLSYLVCALPRSGSNLLCYSLIENGDAGVPLEYFNESSEPTFRFIARTSANQFHQPEYLEPYTQPPLPVFIRHLQHWRTTANGVWGSKIFLHRLQYYFLEKPTAFNDCFQQELKFIHIIRQDKVAQAVSHFLATKKASWSNLKQSNSRKVQYCYEDLLTIYENFNRLEAATKSFFSQLPDSQLLRLNYAELATQYEDSLEKVYRFLNIEPAQRRPKPLRRQMSAQKIKFCKKFARDLRRNGLI